MFSQTIIGSDLFLDMPLTAQALYFHLSVRADDDGFIDNPKTIQRMVGASADDLKLLITKNFLICFENGVVVVRHWRIHNSIQKDRYKPTQYQDLWALITVEENKIYKSENVLDTNCFQNGNGLDTVCIQNVSKVDTQIRIDKNRVDKISKKENFIKEKNSFNSSAVAAEKKNFKHKYGEFKNVLLSDEQLKQLKNKFPDDWQKWIETLSRGIEQHGYKYKNHYLAIIQWSEKERKERSDEQRNTTADSGKYGKIDKVF